MAKLSPEERPVIGALANEIRDYLNTEIDRKKDEIEKELLQEYAEEYDMTVSQIIRRLIKDFLDAEIGR